MRAGEEKIATGDGEGSPPTIRWRGALLDAMRGHVVAWGEIVRTYART